MNVERLDRDTLVVSGRAAASAEAVWNALTTGRGDWWPELELAAIVGSPVRETWTVEDEERSADGQVVEIVPGAVLVFDWRQRAWNAPLRVRFDLVETRGATTVTITETGFAQLASGELLRAEHDEGWRYHLGNLLDAAVR